MLIFICLMVLVQAYVLKGMVPTYHMGQAAAAVTATDFSAGYNCLLLLAALIAGFALLIFLLNRKQGRLNHE